MAKYVNLGFSTHVSTELIIQLCKFLFDIKDHRHRINNI